MATKPNLLFIFTDQQRADTMACYGNERIEAPNLNALARESFVFEHAYCTQPVCTPSRSSIMTGLYPHTTGCLTNNLRLDAATPTIAELVGDGYERGYYGKWHLGDEISAQHGFERWLSIEENYRSYYSNPEDLERFSDYHEFLIESGFEPDAESEGRRVFARQTAAELPEAFTKATFLGQRAAEFVRENAGRRWMLYVNFLEPHPPYAGPLNDLHADDVIDDGPHFFTGPPAGAARANHLKADEYRVTDWRGFDLTQESGWRRLRRNYAGNVTLIDRATGAILDALAASGQANNTIVVFTSDHGDMLGEHCIQGKGVQYENSARIPLLMRVPWLDGAPRMIPGAFSQIDLVPTLLDLLDEPIPDHVHGESRTDVLRGDADLSTNDVVVEWNVRPDAAGIGSAADHTKQSELSPRRTIVSHERWKLNLNVDDRNELYDLNTDPFEMVNRVDDAPQQDRVRDLTERIRAWQVRTDDVLELA